MKKITYLILLKTLLFAGFSFGQNPIPTPAFRFESDVYKFGKVQADSILSFFYTFQNTGNAPLVIADIKVECGCTQADWPDQPVAPGATDTIFVAFDTAGKWGFQKRTLEITANTLTNPTILTFKGVVEKEKLRD